MDIEELVGYLRKRSDLNIPEYSFIVLTGEKQWDIYEALSTVGGDLDIENLEERGWIKYTSHEDEGSFRLKVVPRKAFNDLRDWILGNEGEKTDETTRDKKYKQCFDELFGNFPAKVRGPNGQHRPLRAKSEGTKDYRVCRDKYIKILKEGYSHDRIMKALKAELEEKRRSDSMGYMKALVHWLNARQFEMYEHLIEEEEKKEESNYGRSII